jgi:hypothetical protein
MGRIVTLADAALASLEARLDALVAEFDAVLSEIDSRRTRRSVSAATARPQPRLLERHETAHRNHT